MQPFRFAYLCVFFHLTLGCYLTAQQNAPSFSASTQSDAQITALLAKFRTRHKFYIEPNIPPKLLRTARAEVRVPPAEHVLALLDPTLRGTAERCLLFCSKGIYFSSVTVVPGYSAQGYVPYSDFPKIRFRKIRFTEISLGDNRAFDTLGSGFTPNDLLGLLMSIKTAVTSHEEQNQQATRSSTEHSTQSRLLTGTILLKTEENITADQLELDSTTKIVTNGHDLTIKARAIVVHGTAKVISFEEPAPTGERGHRAGTIVINASAVSGGRLAIENVGQQGGSGSAGTPGTRGAAGSPGGNRNLSVFTGCTSSGDGAQGGKGWPGGPGGKGADGGEGGTIVNLVKTGRDLLSLSVRGGRGGAPGPGGIGGPGGSGGEGGSGNALCSGGRTGPPGQQGANGPDGQPGEDGRDGSIRDVKGQV